MVILSIVVVTLLITVVWLILDRNDITKKLAAFSSKAGSLPGMVLDHHLRLNEHDKQAEYQQFLTKRLSERVVTLERVVKPAKSVKRATRKRKA